MASHSGGRLRWRWNQILKSLTHSSAVLFFLGSAVVASVVGIVFFWLVISSFQRPDSGIKGCLPDGEGSWSIGIYYGKDPFSLVPIELANKQNENSSAWPVANPVLSCASITDAGFPSNFVADPFLFIEGEIMYLFFETKTVSTLQGDIGVARSINLGISWEVLGIALDEPWHLSYPFVFKYNNQVYMMPEGSKKGDLRLYRATNFPLQWKLEKVLIKKPLIDAVLFEYQGTFWIFASDFTRFGVEKNAELEIWYSDSPLGPFKQHRKNPIYRSNKSLGARNGGHPFFHASHLYRPGQNCGSTYGGDLVMYKVSILTKDDFQEHPVNHSLEKFYKGRNSWNGLRRHHLDAQQLSSGEWIAVTDGDRVPSGESTRRFLLGYMFLALFVILLPVIGVLAGAITCQRRYLRRPRRRVNGKFVKWVLVCVAIALICAAEHYIFSGDGSELGYVHGGHYSKFTMVTMTYEARIWNLKLFVKHYSRCASVKEIVVVWNKGKPPIPEELDSSVPVRVQVSSKNSLNNRFKQDKLIATKGVFQLDDDIMMTCTDVERGFKVWRENPDRMVGFYPRLLDGEYRDEMYARRRGGYNVVLTGAAFMDGAAASQRYWSEKAAEGRKIVDENFNCEDLLMNFLYANESNGAVRTVEYVHPAWAIDTSKFSAAAISRNTQVHYAIRTRCLEKFSAIYGPLPERIEFGLRDDRWDT